MPEQTYLNDLDSDPRTAQSLEHRKLVVELEDRISKLNDQAKIFIPLIAMCLIVAIPIWSKSLQRFLILLLSPFVLLPLGFCLVPLVLAWRGIAKARTRIREWERVNQILSGKLLVCRLTQRYDKLKFVGQLEPAN